MSQRTESRVERADAIADCALQLFTELPREEVTLTMVAERLGLSYWQVSRIFSRVEQIYRVSTARLANRIFEAISAASVTESSVHAAIRSFTRQSAEVVASDAYQQFVYLLVRDGCVHPSLKQQYEERIASPISSGLEDAVRQAGERHGAIVLLQPGAPRRFLSQLESAFVLPKLLPGFLAPEAGQSEATVNMIAREVMDASYVLNWATQAA